MSAVGTLLTLGAPGTFLVVAACPAAKVERKNHGCGWNPMVRQSKILNYMEGESHWSCQRYDGNKKRRMLQHKKNRRHQLEWWSFTFPPAGSEECRPLRPLWGQGSATTGQRCSRGRERTPAAEGKGQEWRWEDFMLVGTRKHVSMLRGRRSLEREEIPGEGGWGGDQCTKAWV